MKDKNQDKSESVSREIRDNLSAIAEAARTYPGLSSESDRIPGLARDLQKKLAVFAYRLQMPYLWIVFLGGTGTGKSTLMKVIAGETGGKAFDASSAQELQRVYAQIDELEKSEIETNSYTYKRYYYVYPLFIAVLSLLLYIYLRNKRGWVS